jgi:hypothetical protein
MKMRLLAFIGLAALSMFAADEKAPLPQGYSVKEVEDALLAGKIRPDLAASAQKRKQGGGNLYVREILGEPIPFQLFTFDLAEGYTVVVEAKEKITVLCSAFGGGYASNFRLSKEGADTVLRYRYTSGSGFRFEHEAMYVLGSGAPRDTAPRKNVAPR